MIGFQTNDKLSTLVTQQARENQNHLPIPQAIVLNGRKVTADMWQISSFFTRLCSPCHTGKYDVFVFEELAQKDQPRIISSKHHPKVCMFFILFLIL
jgi:hypothetical protein